MECIDDILKYEGYKGFHLDNFDFNKLQYLSGIEKKINKKLDYIFLNNCILDLESLNLEEAIDIVKDFYNDYFKVHNINYVDEALLDETVKGMNDNISASEFYDAINKILVSINPLDLPFVINGEYNLDSRIKIPIYVYSGYPNEKNREMYFSKVTVGNLINSLTPVFVAHEMMHLETLSVIGYADDYLNCEVLSIFIEKIAALNMDKSLKLLKIIEKIRMRDLIEQYNKYLRDRHQLLEEDMLISLMYIKSSLVAQKLFDMYIREKREEKRDQYIYDIQDVIDGKMKVEELLLKRGITAGKCEYLKCLRRHI